jgi:murein DD-endopeptidase MepM/ murein hydrolase activator NlpD
MALKKSYKFNFDILDFIEVRRSWLYLLGRGILAVFVALLFFGAYYMLFSLFINTPEERNLMKIKETMNQNYTPIIERYNELAVVINDLQERDANIYRYIFETEPPSSNSAENDELLSRMDNLSNVAIVRSTNNALDALQKIAAQQTKILEQITITCLKNPAMPNLPTLQPVENVDFRYIAATYGMRMHPFYKVLKLHTGIDFSSPMGSNVYATAAGKVVRVERNYRNIGLNVVIDHGSGYQTHYQHLNEANVRANQTVARMQTIGTVGNSGRSVAPHLHYEIWKNGKHVNPIHFFFANITPADYQLLKVLEANKGQSLD